MSGRKEQTMSKWVNVDRLLLEMDDLADEFSELDENGLHSERWCGIMDAKGVIVNAPSIDIVFCKECKHKQHCGKAVQHTTHKPTSVTIAYRPINYCSYGEREGE